MVKASLKEAVSADGKRGRHLDMPLVLGPKKSGEDKAGSPCVVWDFVVHPETMDMAAATPAVMKALIENVRTPMSDQVLMEP